MLSSGKISRTTEFKHLSKRSPTESLQSEALGTCKERIVAVLEQIQSVADEVGIPMSKLVIAWILKNPIITAAILGASSTEQVEENCRTTEININNETYRKPDKLTEYVEASLYS